MNALFRRWLGGLSSEKRLTLSVAHIAFSNGMRTFLTLVSSLVVTRILGPTLMGHYTTSRLIGLYLTPTYLGATQGMEQQVPILNGAGDVDTARRLRESVFAFVVAISAVTTLSGITILIVGHAKGNPIISIVIAGGFFVYLTNLLLQYTNIELYTSKRFRAVSIKTLACSIVTVISLPLVVLGLGGAVARQCLISAIEAAMGAAIGKVNLRMRFDSQLLKQAIKLGLPIYAISFLLQYPTALDRTLVRTFMGTKELGLYSIGAAMTGLALVVPQALTSVLYPTAGEIFGKTRDLRQTAAVIAKPLPWLWLTSLVTVPIGVFALPPVIRMFLSEYVPGIVSAQVSVGVFGVSLFAYGGFFFFLIGQKRLLLLLILASLGVQLDVSLWLYAHTGKLESFMYGTLAGSAIFAIALNAIILMTARGKIRFKTP